MENTEFICLYIGKKNHEKGGNKRKLHNVILLFKSRSVSRQKKYFEDLISETESKVEFFLLFVGLKKVLGVMIFALNFSISAMFMYCFFNCISRPWLSDKKLNIQLDNSYSLLYCQTHFNIKSNTVLGMIIGQN